MTDINKLSVLNAFSCHQQLSWTDFTTKDLFLNIENGSERAKYLGDIIRQLEYERLIVRTENSVPPTWVLLDNGTSEQNKIITTIQRQSQKDNLDFENAKLDNWQKRNWLWLTIGGYIFGIISTLLVESIKTKYLDTNSKDKSRQVISDSSSLKKVH